MDVLEIIQKRVLGGNAREFRDAVRSAIADGKLTEAEIGDLERKREELKLPAEVLSSVRMDLYMDALSKVNEDDTVTDEEWQEMEQIQDYLGIEDKDIAKTKKELYRGRIMSEIKKGNMPVIETKDVLLGKDEIAYWEEPVALYEAAEKKGKGFTGVELELPIGVRFSVGAKTAKDEKGWKKVADGELILTSERLLFQSGAHSFVMPWTRVAAAQFFVSGIAVQASRGDPKYLKYAGKGNHNIVGSIVAFAHASAKRA